MLSFFTKNAPFSRYGQNDEKSRLYPPFWGVVAVGVEIFKIVQGFSRHFRQICSFLPILSTISMCKSTSPNSESGFLHCYALWIEKKKVTGASRFARIWSKNEIELDSIFLIARSSSEKTRLLVYQYSHVRWPTTNFKNWWLGKFEKRKMTTGKTEIRSRVYEILSTRLRMMLHNRRLSTLMVDLQLMLATKK